MAPPEKRKRKSDDRSPKAKRQRIAKSTHPMITRSKAAKFKAKQAFAHSWRAALRRDFPNEEASTSGFGDSDNSEQKLNYRMIVESGEPFNDDETDSGETAGAGKTAGDEVEVVEEDIVGEEDVGGEGVEEEDVGEDIVEEDDIGEEGIGEEGVAEVVFGEGVYGEGAYGEGVYGGGVFGEGVFAEGLFGEDIFGEEDVDERIKPGVMFATAEYEDEFTSYLLDGQLFNAERFYLLSTDEDVSSDDVGLL